MLKCDETRKQLVLVALNSPRLNGCISRPKLNLIKKTLEYV